MEENIKKIEQFFKYNLKAKNIMYEMAFKDEYSYNKESMFEYENKLFKSLEILEMCLTSIVLLFGSDESKITKIENQFKVYKKEFMEATLNPALLKEAYQRNISNMRVDFVKSINEGFFGYSVFRGNGVLEPTSVNEYLHLLHASLVNNEKIYQMMPVLAEKKENGTNVKMYGRENKEMSELLKEIELKDAELEILNLTDRTLIMARDLGHATTMEITFQNNKAVVNYFIPKVCNYTMAEKLPGINSLNKNNRFAKGAFETEKENLKDSLISFMSKIPKDEDMFIEGGINYRPERML